MKAPRPKGCKVHSTFSPLYRACVWLVIGKDQESAARGRRAFDEILGKFDCYGAKEDHWDGSGALCSYNGRDIALFLRVDEMTHGMVAHEVLHATIRILQRIGYKLDPDNSEPFTYLLEWLTEWVYGYVKPQRGEP